VFPPKHQHQHQQEEQEQEQEQEQEPCTAVKVTWDTRAAAHSAAPGPLAAPGKKGGKAVVLLGAGAAGRALAAGVDGFRSAAASSGRSQRAQDGLLLKKQNDVHRPWWSSICLSCGGSGSEGTCRLSTKSW
jgi:hypothetical protein